MSRLQAMALTAILAAIALTGFANIAATVSDQLMTQAPAKPDATPTTRTRVITSVLDADPTVVGAIPRRPAEPPR